MGILVPTLGKAHHSMTVKIGVSNDGKITAADAELRFQGGAFPGSPVVLGSMAAFACYGLENVRTVGFDVVTSRPKAAAYRAPGAPIAAFGVESVVQELADKLGMDAMDHTVASAGLDSVVRLWDIRSGQQVPLSL